MQNLEKLDTSQKQHVNISKKLSFSTRVENAKIQVICGPMFSGKTKTLIKYIDEYKSNGKKVFVFKPNIDDRYSVNNIVSHDKDETEAYNVSKAAEILDLFHHADVIAIDEVQFFDDSIVEVSNIIANFGKTVLLAGLDMDYKARSFGSMPRLLALADEVIKLNSVCTFCSGRARYSHRISDDNGIVVLGETDKYVPLCRSCYHELKE